MAEDEFFYVDLHGGVDSSTTQLTYSEGQYISTELGSIQVTVTGNRSKPAILTFHDIGMNSTSCFQRFFNFPHVQPIIKHFSIYHVNAPGQEENASPLPENFNYPSLDDLAEALKDVMKHYGLKTFVGFGVGAGANILSRFALSNPDSVDGLVLVNCTVTQAGWIECFYQKWNVWCLKRSVLSAVTEDYFLWHWFGQKRLHSNPDLSIEFIHFLRSMIPRNLGYFIECNNRRTDLHIVRELDPAKLDQARNFKCPVLLLAGSDSPHLNNSVEANNRINPSKVTLAKFDCGGMVLEEEPALVTEAFLYFLQGLGYVPTLRSASYSKYLATRGTPKPSREPVF